MIARLLLVALLGQGAPDGGPAGVEQLYTACPDAPLLVEVDGGYFTPELRQRRENCRMAACESYAQAHLAEAPASAASPGLVLGLVGGGLILVGLAALGGYLLPHPK